MAEGNRESVPIDRILIEGTQTRESIRSDVVDEYAENFSDLPPIRVFFDGINYWLSDGFHRFEAAKKSNIKYIPGDVFRGDQRDAIMDAVGANETHGLRRSNDDRRRAVRLLLDDEEWRGWANTEIALQCRVSEYFVRTVKNEIGFDEREEDEARPRKTTRKGKQVTVRTKSIGRGRQKSPEEPKPPADEQLPPGGEPVEEQPSEAVTSIESKFDEDEIGAEVSALPKAQEVPIPAEDVSAQPEPEADHSSSLIVTWDQVGEVERHWFVERRYDELLPFMQRVASERKQTTDEPKVDAENTESPDRLNKTQSELIIDALSSADGPLTRDELAEREGISKRQLGRNLTRLVQRGQIVASADGKYALSPHD